MSDQFLGAAAGVPNLVASPRTARRRVLSDRPGIVVGVVIATVVLAVCIVGPFISGHDAYAIDPSNRYAEPSASHWFGTDSFGRDVFTRVAVGGRNSLFIGTAVMIVSVIVGGVVGMYATTRATLDAVFMRITDGLVAFPAILLAIIVTLALGQSNLNVAIALSIVFAPMVARLVRSRVLVEKELSYVEVLQSQGASTSRVLWSNIAPNVLALVTVQATFIFGEAVIVEAGLSFVGAGVPQPEPSWGGMVYEGRGVLESAWWLTAAPGAMLALTVLATVLIGDGIRDAYDPSSLPTGAVTRFRRWSNSRSHTNGERQ